MQLRAQTGRYARLVDWIGANLDQPLDIATLAARAGGFTSAEQLSRAFRRRLDLSPSEYRRQHRGA